MKMPMAALTKLALGSIRLFTTHIRPLLPAMHGCQYLSNSRGSVIVSIVSLFTCHPIPIRLS